jgi:hypothetical protein
VHDLIRCRAKLLEHVLKGTEPRLVGAHLLGADDEFEGGLEVCCEARSISGVAVGDDDQRDFLSQAVQCLGDTRVRAPGGDNLVDRLGIGLTVLNAEPARGAFHGVGDDLAERLVIAHALVNPVRLRGLQVLIGELGRQPVTQDLTGGVGNAELDQRSVHVKRNELRLGLEYHESSNIDASSIVDEGSKSAVDCRQYAPRPRVVNEKLSSFQPVATPFSSLLIVDCSQFSSYCCYRDVDN